MSQVVIKLLDSTHFTYEGFCVDRPQPGSARSGQLQTSHSTPKMDGLDGEEIALAACVRLKLGKTQLTSEIYREPNPVFNERFVFYFSKSTVVSITALSPINAESDRVLGESQFSFAGCQNGTFEFLCPFERANNPLTAQLRLSATITSVPVDVDLIESNIPRLLLRLEKTHYYAGELLRGVATLSIGPALTCTVPKDQLHRTGHTPFGTSSSGVTHAEFKSAPNSPAHHLTSSAANTHGIQTPTTAASTTTPHSPTYHSGHAHFGAQSPSSTANLGGAAGGDGPSKAAAISQPSVSPAHSSARMRVSVIGHQEFRTVGKNGRHVDLPKQCIVDVSAPIGQDYYETGEYMFPFSIQLPMNLPASDPEGAFSIASRTDKEKVVFRQCYNCTIRLCGTLPDGEARDYLATKTFFVHNDYTQFPLAVSSLTTTKTKKAKVEVLIEPQTKEQNLFYPGTRTFFDCIITNKTKKKINLITVSFERHFDFDGKSKVDRLHDQILQLRKYFPISSGESVAVPVSIPLEAKLDPSLLASYSPDATLTYLIHVRLKASSKDMSFYKEVLIGAAPSAHIDYVKPPVFLEEYPFTFFSTPPSVRFFVLPKIPVCDRTKCTFAKNEAELANHNNHVMTGGVLPDLGKQFYDMFSQVLFLSIERHFTLKASQERYSSGTVCHQCIAPTPHLRSPEKDETERLGSNAHSGPGWDQFRTGGFQNVRHSLPAINPSDLVVAAEDPQASPPPSDEKRLVNSPDAPDKEPTNGGPPQPATTSAISPSNTPLAEKQPAVSLSSIQRKTDEKRKVRRKEREEKRAATAEKKPRERERPRSIAFPEDTSPRQLALIEQQASQTPPTSPHADGPDVEDEKRAQNPPPQESSEEKSGEKAVVVPKSVDQEPEKTVVVVPVEVVPTNLESTPSKRHRSSSKKKVHRRRTGGKNDHRHAPDPATPGKTEPTAIVGHDPIVAANENEKQPVVVEVLPAVIEPEKNSDNNQEIPVIVTPPEDPQVAKVKADDASDDRLRDEIDRELNDILAKEQEHDEAMQREKERQRPNGSVSFDVPRNSARLTVERALIEEDAGSEQIESRKRSIENSREIQNEEERKLAEMKMAFCVESEQEKRARERQEREKRMKEQSLEAEIEREWEKLEHARSKKIELRKKLEETRENERLEKQRLENERLETIGEINQRLEAERERERIESERATRAEVARRLEEIENERAAREEAERQLKLEKQQQLYGPRTHLISSSSQLTSTVVVTTISQPTTNPGTPNSRHSLSPRSSMLLSSAQQQSQPTIVKITKSQVSLSPRTTTPNGTMTPSASRFASQPGIIRQQPTPTKLSANPSTAIANGSNSTPSSSHSSAHQSENGSRDRIKQTSAASLTPQPKQQQEEEAELKSTPSKRHSSQRHNHSPDKTSTNDSKRQLKDEPVKKESTSAIAAPTQNSASSTANSDNNIAPPSPLQPQSTPLAARKGTAIAEFRFDGQDRRELSFCEGDEITILKKDASGWWQGRLKNGVVGWLPGNYVREVS